MQVYYIDGPYAGQTREEVKPTTRVAVYSPPETRYTASEMNYLYDHGASCIEYVEYQHIGRHPKTGVYYAVVAYDTREHQVDKLQKEVSHLRNKLRKVEEAVKYG